MQSEELKPCPFCGGLEFTGPFITEYLGDSWYPHWWLECNTCPGGMTVYSEHKHDLITKWNTRYA